jgi:malonate transporter and related proteins
VLDILSATVPIFLIVGLGFALTRGGMLERQDMSVLSTYVVKLALPALIFINVLGRSFADILNSTYLLVYAIAAMAMVGLGVVWGRARGAGPARTATLSFAMSGTNNGFVGFPIFLLVLPEVAGLAVGMDMLVDNILIIPVALAMFESVAGRHHTHWGRRLTGIGLRVVTHPMVIALIAALALTWLGVELPAMLERAVTLVANSSSAVALFAIGGMLVGLRLKGQLADLVAAVSGKLVVSPAIAAALVVLLPLVGLPTLSHDLRAAVILTAALPSMSSVGAFAEQHGEGDFGAATMMLSTVVAFVTLTAWMVGLSAVGWL